MDVSAEQSSGRFQRESISLLWDSQGTWRQNGDSAIRYWLVSSPSWHPELLCLALFACSHLGPRPIHPSSLWFVSEQGSFYIVQAAPESMLLPQPPEG